MSLSSLLRRARRGPPIIVVSGLPRSGTSMMMRMLAAGGIELVTGGERVPDEHNPRGYFEFEPVKDLAAGASPAWLREARGRAVKIIAFLIPRLRDTYDYRVIFMRRDLDEVIASQRAMLLSRGVRDEEGNDALARAFTGHLDAVTRFLDSHPCFSRLDVDYHAVLADPQGQAARVSRFLGRRLDTRAMAGAVEAQLHRQRRPEGRTEAASR